MTNLKQVINLLGINVIRNMILGIAIAWVTTITISETLDFIEKVIRNILS